MSHIETINEMPADAYLPPAAAAAAAGRAAMPKVKNLFRGRRREAVVKVPVVRPAPSPPAARREGDDVAAASAMAALAAVSGWGGPHRRSLAQPIRRPAWARDVEPRKPGDPPSKDYLLSEVSPGVGGNVVVITARNSDESLAKAEALAVYEGLRTQRPSPLPRGCAVIARIVIDPAENIETLHARCGNNQTMMDAVDACLARIEAGEWTFPEVAGAPTPKEGDEFR